VPGVFSAGDAASPLRAVGMALSMGGVTAAGLVKELQREKALEED